MIGESKMKILKLTILISLSILILGLTSCGKLETETHEISEDFTNISIVNDTASVVFVPTDGECKVVCDEKKNVNHKVEVVDGTLKIEVVDSRKFFQKIFSFGDDKVTVYLPASQYGAISVKTDTGKVEIDGIGCNSFSLEVNTGDVSLKNLSSASSLEVKSNTGKVALENCRASTISIVSDTGDIKMTDVFCINMSSRGDTGKTTMNNVIASGKLEISSNTGDVNFEGCDGAEVCITTDTGDVKGSFLTAKIVFAETDTGKVDVPKLTSGGRCEITTDTGDIKITIN